MQEDLKKETLHKQFLIVKKHTNTSHVMQYGNKVSIHLSGFQVKSFPYILIPSKLLYPDEGTNPQLLNIYLKN